MKETEQEKIRKLVMKAIMKHALTMANDSIDDFTEVIDYGLQAKELEVIISSKDNYNYAYQAYKEGFRFYTRWT